MDRSPRIRLGVLLALLLMMGAQSARAQTLYGTVVGTVVDESRGAVPGATIALRSSATGLELTTVTGETGTYTVANVLPGTYDVIVTLQGFREARRTDVPITAGTVARVDVTLQVGDLSESVTVASEAALLQTDKSDSRVELRSRDIVDMPLPAYTPSRSSTSRPRGCGRGTSARYRPSSTTRRPVPPMARAGNRLPATSSRPDA